MATIVTIVVEGATMDMGRALFSHHLVFPVNVSVPSLLANVLLNYPIICSWVEFIRFKKYLCD